MIEKNAAVRDERSLVGSVHGRADGRSILIDYYATARCNVVVGDLTAAFTVDRPPEQAIKVAELEAVDVYAHPQLLPLLERTGLSIISASWPHRGGLAVRLDEPAEWLLFLERPGVRRRRDLLRSSGEASTSPI